MQLINVTEGKLFEFETKVDTRIFTEAVLNYEKAINAGYDARYDISTGAAMKITEMHSHHARYCYDILTELSELELIKTQFVAAAKQVMDPGRYLMHSWVNIGAATEIIKSHIHRPKYHGIVYMDVGNSGTCYQVDGNGPYYIEGAPGKMVIARSAGTPHWTTPRTDSDNQRITIAANFVAVEPLADMGDRNYLGLVSSAVTLTEVIVE